VFLLQPFCTQTVSGQTMKRSLSFIAVACLTAGFSKACALRKVLVQAC
jgi:hypothetical protein